MSGVELGHPQSPPAQTWPPVQAVPHCPQFAGSVCLLTHFPPHMSVWPGGQAHAPSTQLWLARHAWPHEPQLAKSVLRSAHVSPHLSSPAGHWHRPITQIASDIQACAAPHPPQLFGSDARSTQRPLHTVDCSGGHAQPPLMHAAPMGHRCPHCPQFAGSVAVSTHFPLQILFGIAQMHCPELQASPTGHLVPHLPQLDTSVSRLVQRPGLPHWVVPVGHWQKDPMHAPPAGQRWPHWLQLLASDVRSVHLLPHRAIGLAQTHWPPVQAALAVHFAPQEPQLLELVLRSTHWLPHGTRPLGHAVVLVVVVVGVVVVEEVEEVDELVWPFAVKV